MKQNIRPMNTSDIETVYAIEKTVHIAPWSKEILRDCVLVGYDCRVLELDTDDGKVVAGYIICRLSSTMCHILNFCIAKSLQSKGLGRKLLEDVLNSIKAESVVLEVRPSNYAALHLYNSLGFVPVEIKKDYYKDQNSTEDAIVLKK